MRACRQQLENGACRVQNRSSRAKATQAHSCAELISAACKRTWRCASHRWPLRTRSNAQQRHAAAGGSQHEFGMRRAVERSAAAATSGDRQILCSRTTFAIRGFTHVSRRQEERKLIESGITCTRTLKIQLIWLVYMIAHAGPESATSAAPRMASSRWDEIRLPFSRMTHELGCSVDGTCARDTIALFKDDPRAGLQRRWDVRLQV